MKYCLLINGTMSRNRKCNKNFFQYEWVILLQLLERELYLQNDKCENGKVRLDNHNHKCFPLSDQYSLSRVAPPISNLNIQLLMS